MVSDQVGQGRAGAQSARALDGEAVRAAYRRWSAIYDTVFGAIWAQARRRAAAAVNALPGTRVLEVGVGTGLALPCYHADKRVVGIDLSPEMLARARERARALPHVEALHELDAEDTGLPDASFDIAVAMFVATVVPDPRRLVSEMRRLVRPGGHILFVNHFRASAGPRWWIERALAPAASGLGWRPDFAVEDLLAPADIARARLEPMPPYGIFTLLHLPN